MLVARIRSDGASRRTASASTAQASRRCSQLSRTSNNRLEATYSINRDTGHWLDSSRRPSEIMTVFVTSSASSRPASSTSHTPSGMPRLRSAADLRRQSRLAHPTRPDKRHETGSAQGGLDLLQLAASTDEGRQLGRQVAPRRCGAVHRALLRASVARSVTATSSVTPTVTGSQPMDRARRDHVRIRRGRDGHHPRPSQAWLRRRSTRSD